MDAIEVALTVDKKVVQTVEKLECWRVVMTVAWMVQRRA